MRIGLNRPIICMAKLTSRLSAYMLTNVGIINSSFVGLHRDFLIKR